MTENKFNPEIAKKLYDQAMEVGTSNISEDDFYSNLDDKEYAAKVYNRYKDKYGVNLLDAEDDNSFLDTLGYKKDNGPTTATETKPVAGNERKPVNVETPESINTDVPKVNYVAPKTPDMNIEKPQLMGNILGERKVNPDEKFNIAKNVFGVDDIYQYRNPQEKLQDAINQLGKDEVETVYDDNGDIVGQKVVKTAQQLDVERIDAIKKEIQRQYEADSKFVNEYESVLFKDNVTHMNTPKDTYSVTHPSANTKHSFSMTRPSAKSKTGEDEAYLKENADRYNKVKKAREALQLQMSFADTYAELAEYDRSVAVGEDMSSMVSSGEITEDAMSILRSSKSPQASKEYIERQVKNGTMTRSTANKLYDLGDLSEKNAFGYGFTHHGKAEDMLSFGITEINRNFDVKDIYERIKKGEDVSQEETNVIDMYNKMSEMLSEAKQDKRGWLFQAGQGLPKTLQFIAEIGITGGASAAGKGMTRKFILESIKKYGLKRAFTDLAKETGSRLTKNAFQQAVFAPFTPSAYVDYSNRVLNMTFEQDDVSWKDKLAALYKSYAQAWSGRFSETLDNVIFDMPLGTWLYSTKYLKPVLEPAAWIAKKLDNVPWSKQTSEFLERFGIDGMHKEILTEMSDPLLYSAATGFTDTEELKKMDLNFVKQVALHSAILGGFHGAMSYGVGAGTAALENKRVNKAYDDVMGKINRMKFVDKDMDSLREELITAISRNNFVPTENNTKGRTVGEILGDMNARMQSFSQDEQNKATYKEDKRIFETMDYAARVGSYKFGANQYIKDQVSHKMGVKVDDKGNKIPIEFEHSDGTVHELSLNGKEYFVLDESNSAVVVVDRATGEKEIISKDSFGDYSVKQTDANDWAMNTYLVNFNNWKAEEAQSNQGARYKAATPPTHVMLDGIQLPVTNFDAQNGEVTITDNTGDELTLSIDDPGIELVYPNEQTPVQAEENQQPVVEETAVEQPKVAPEGSIETETPEPAYVAPRGEDNEVVWNEVPADKFKEVIDQEVGEEYADGYIDMRIAKAQENLEKYNQEQPPVEPSKYKVFMEQAKALQNEVAYWTNAKHEYANAITQEVEQPAVEDIASEQPVIPEEEISKIENTETPSEQVDAVDAEIPTQEEVATPLVSKEELDTKVADWNTNGVKVNVVNSIDEITNEQVLTDMKKGEKITGWYDTATGEVYVFAPYLSDTAELDSTIIHEVVAHKGLRGLVGETYYKQFCEKVFDSMPKEIQDKYLAYPGVNGDKAAAADEYIAYLAEKQDLTAEEQTAWDKIIQMFRELFDRILVNTLKKDTFTDEDIARLIRMSYANIKNEAANSSAETTTGVVSENAKNGQAMYSIKTYREGGRDNLVKFTQKQVESNKLTEQQAAEIVSEMDSIYDMIQQYKDVYQPFGAWSEAEVKVDETGKAVFSVVKPNGEYGMNLDFSLVCKKRRTLDSVFDEMISRGIISEFDLDQIDVAKINEIIREFGFETACRLCFVDAKRFRVAEIADNFCTKYNELVVMNDKQLKEVIKTEEKNTARKKIAKHLLNNPQDKVILSRDNFMSAKGFENVKVNKSAVMSLYNQAKGTGGPKASFGDVQYLNDIADSSWTPEKAYAVGGVRLQSFSDYVPRMVFDYIQMVADLAAKKLPVHSYTKESIFAKQFGLTGIKINMSLVPRVDTDGIAPGLDKDGNYAWQEGETFPFDEAIAIQNAEGYRDNCGTIAVGVSDEHILKMLDDENIRMIIPYHKSGLNKNVAKFNNIDQFVDYTNPQNTRYADGKKLSKADSKKHFNFNEDLHKSNDPRGAAQRYLEWCDKKGYIPKFEQFRNHPNYYKLLEDFTTVVTENGVDTVVPQKAVEMRFPKETDAFGSLETLIQQGLEEDAVLEGRRSEKIGEIVDKIEETLPKNNPTDPNDGPRYRTSAEIDKEYPNWLEGTTKETGKKGHSTQVAKTVGTYNKVGAWIENNLGKDVEILDASSGMGLGTQSLREKGFNIEDVEPYQSEERKQNNPATYSAYADIDKQYDYIISNAVLNVIPDDWRADVLHNMADRMKDGGKMFINTRMSGQEKDIKDKIELDTPQEVLVKLNGKISSYQKFFTPQELKSWVENELGDGYSVEVANEKNSGTKGLAAVVVSKNTSNDSNGSVRYSVSKNEKTTFNENAEPFQSDILSGGDNSNSKGAPTVIQPRQPESEAKVRNRTNKAKNNIKKFKNGDLNRGDISTFPGFRKELSDALGMRYEGQGEYAVYNTPNGKLAFRFNNHNAFGDNFIRDNADENISIDVEYKHFNFPNSDVPYIEFKYESKDFEEHTEEIFEDIMNAMDIALTTGIFPQSLKYAETIPYNMDKNSTRYRIPSTPTEARQRAENIMKEAIDPMARELGVEVNYVTNESISDVETGARKKRQSKGWYQDGKVYINLSTQETTDDARETYLHEVVGHYGLRGLLKDQFEPVMKKVFASLTPTQQQSLLEIFADEVEAAEEFLSSMAENDIDPTLVDKILGLIRDALRSMGINLDNYTNGDLEYLLWRSKNNLIENAGAIETARWEAEDKEVRYRLGFGRTPLSKDSKYSGLDKLIEQYKDKVWPVKLVQDEIIARGGMIDDSSDAYGQATLMPGRSATAIKNFNNDFYDPMLEVFAKAAKLFSKGTGISRFDANDKIEQYLYARHAIERNRKITLDKMFANVSEIFAVLSADQKQQLNDIIDAMYDDNYTGNPKLIEVVPDPNSTGVSTNLYLNINGAYQKLVFTEDEFNSIMDTISNFVADNPVINESGLTDKEANDIIDDVYFYQSAEMQDALDALSQEVRRCTDFILDTWMDFGIISAADNIKYKNQYQYYVPLRGWDETADVDYEDVAGNAYNRAEKITSLNKQARGRKSKADSPLTYISQMATSAIISGNKNLMKMKAYNMIRKNKKLISDLAFIDDKGQLTHKTKSEIKAHEVQLKMDGRTVRFTFNDEFEVGVAAATAIKGQNVQNVENGLMNLVGRATRLQSQLRTSLNPVFMFTNGIRDYFFGNFKFFIQYGIKDMAALNANYTKGFACAFLDAAGVPVGDGELRKMYEEYKREGGQTGFVHQDDIKRLKRETGKILKKYQNGFTRVSSSVFKLPSYVLRVMGEPAENAMRFATYKTLRDNGVSARQAAKAAKEVTVNFNRSGSQRWPGMLYGFFNATLEGTANYLRMGFNKETAARFYIANAAMMALSYVMAGWAKGFDDDDDDIIEGMSEEELAEYKQQKEFANEYNRISDYVKHTNILIPVTGDESGEKKFIAIPLPQSFRISSTLGVTLRDIISNDNDVADELREFGWFTIGELQPFDIENVSIEGGGFLKTFGKIAAPTLIQPEIEVAQNRNFMGLPIRKESFINENYQEPLEPSYTKAGSKTPEIFISTAKGLNEWLGGDENISAKHRLRLSENRHDAHSLEYILALTLDAADPSSVDHILKGMFGGFYEIGLNAIDRSMSDDEKTVEDLVITQRFLKSATQAPGVSRYYEFKEWADYVERVLKNEKKHAEDGEENQYLNSDGYDELVKANKYWKKEIKKITDDIAKLKKGDNVDKTELEGLEAERNKTILEAALEFERLNREYKIFK